MLRTCRNAKYLWLSWSQAHHWALKEAKDMQEYWNKTPSQAGSDIKIPLHSMGFGGESIESMKVVSNCFFLEETFAHHLLPYISHREMCPWVCLP